MAMKKLKFTSVLFAVTLMIVSVNSMLAQSVSVNLNLLPPYSPKLFSYLKYENKAIITLVNNTGSVQNIRFTGKLEGDKGVIIKTRDGYKPSSPVVLNPRQSMVLTSATGSMDFLADKNNIDVNIDEKLKIGILKDGIIPEGNYTLCIQAFDYYTGSPLSEEICWPLVISYVQPPVIITPADESELANNLPQFSWSPAIGNTSAGSLRYDLYILKLANGQNPQDAMQQAINYNVGNPLKKTNLLSTGYVYTMSDWPLEENEKYAIQVVAKDNKNLLTFANDGKSEIATFTYIPQSTPPPPPAPVESSSDFQCSCTTPVPSGSAKTGFTVSPNDQFQIGSYTLTVTSVTRQPDNQGLFSGEGTIPYPLSNGNSFSVAVDFTDLAVNQSDEAVSGSAIAKVNTDATFIPDINTGNTELDITSTQAQDMIYYFSTHSSQLTSIAQNNQGGTVNLPLGIDKTINGENTIIAVTGMYFKPDKASFDAVTAINIPDASPSVLGFGRRYICLDASSVCNTNSIIPLAQDINLNLVTGTGILVLKGKNTAGGTTPADSGTYISFDKTGFKKLRIHAEYTFPQSIIVQEDNSSPVTATVSASTLSWADWIGTVTFNNGFKANGINDFVYTVTTAYYDHSDVRNPSGIPSLYTLNDPSGNQPYWQGFLITSGNAGFPGQDMSITMDNSPVSFSYNNLIIDDQGITVDINETGILSLNNGKINGWRFSIDEINVEILKNAITQGEFNGSMLLPIAHDTSTVKYSCLLNMDNGNLDYQFSVQQRNDLKVPMWKAKMDLDQASSIEIVKNNGEFNATANLNGSFDIDGNVDMLKKLKLRNIKFQGMTITSQTDVLSVGTLSKGSSTDNSKISGFVLDVSEVSVVPGTQPVIELKSEIELVKFVSLPLAKTTFSIYGEKSTTASRSYYDFDKGLIDSLKISGDLSAFKITGVLCFYKEDQIYGDGFRGKAVVEIPELVTVTCKAQFGTIEKTTDDYKYWYIDAFAEIPGGVAMFPPYVYGYGFGGGAYYHMRRDTTSKKSEIVTEDPENHKNSNTAPSGINYIPDESISLGLKAMLLFGLQERKTFNADVNVEMDFNQNGGVNSLYLDGNARIVAKSDDSKEAMVTGNISVQYDVVQNKFLAIVNGNLDLKAVKATVPSQFYFGPDGWYIYMGRPRPEESCTLTILDLFTLKAYFEAGTILDPVPSIPQDVLAVLNSCGVNTDFLTRQNTALINGGRGMIFGADMEFHYSGTFLIIRGSLDAHAGFDFSLRQTNYSCDGSGDPAGVNGWYAMGQLYAAVEAALSIHVDLSFYELNVKILEAMAGAVLVGGAPNPTWIEGAIAGHFSVLSGLIEGNFSYKFSHGDKCVTQSSDVLESLDIISEIYPSDEDNTDISIDIFPVVATNLKISPMHFTIDEIDHDNGTVTQRVFRFNDENVTFSLRKSTGSQQVTCGKIMSEDGFGFTINPHTILSPTTEYELIIYATVDEFINGAWHRAQKQDGTDFVESDSVIFTTGPGLAKLSEDNIKYTIPFSKQRNFVPQGFTSGTITMIQNMDFNAFALPVDPAEYNIEFFADFIPLGNANGQGTETPVTVSGKSFNFNIPSSMQPSTIYCMQFKARWTPKQQSNMPYQLMQLKMIGSWQAAGTNITQSRREINQDKLVVAENEQLLYSLYFRTSEYGSYIEKLDDLEIGQMVLDTRFAVDIHGDAVYNTRYILLSGDDLDNETSIMGNIRQQLGVSPTQSLGMLYPHGICLSGGEQFDPYEIEGYSKQNKTGNTYTTEPVISLDEFSISQFASRLFYDIVDILEAGGARRFEVIPYDDKIGGYVASKELEANTAPLLSDNEIFDGLEMFYFPQGTTCDKIMLDNVITEPPAGNNSLGMTYNLSGSYVPAQVLSNSGTGNASNYQQGAMFQSQNVSVQAAFSLGSFNQKKFVLPDKVNVINFVYHFNYQSGHGMATIPNIFLNKVMQYTDPSPEAFGSFYSNVGQAYDVATSALDNMSIGAASVSANLNSGLGAIGGQVNLNVGFGK